MGKKTSQGYGRVLRWSVAKRCSFDRDEILRARPLPLTYLDGAVMPGGMVLAPRRGWTPPYWHRPWHEACAVPRG